MNASVASVIDDRLIALPLAPYPGYVQFFCGHVFAARPGTSGRSDGESR
jgi:hypothetical protein